VVTREPLTDALLDDLADDGEFVAEGGFSVDIRQAGTKLQAFRLADPGAWIVLLIEGAIAAGASTIELAFGRGEIDIDIRKLELRASELERFGVWLASAPQDPHSRAHAVHLLALAYQAAQARADGLLVESGARRLRWTAAEQTHDALDPRADTRVLVELGDSEGERELLFERCVYAQIDIFVDGEQIAWGWRRAFGARDSPRACLPCPDPEPLRIDGEIAGLAGFAFERLVGASLLVLIHGVLSERIELDGPLELQRGFVAIVEAPALGRDLGLAKLTRDERFDALLAHVEAARARLHDEHEGSLDLRRAPKRSASGSPSPIFVVVAISLVMFTIALIVLLT